MLTAISVILNSLSFWITNSDMISDVGNSLMINFATYPDGIFKGVTKWLLFTLIPVGITNYLPVKTIININASFIVINIGFAMLLVILAYYVFSRGLKRYSSTNLMNARI